MEEILIAEIVRLTSYFRTQDNDWAIARIIFLRQFLTKPELIDGRKDEYVKRAKEKLDEAFRISDNFIDGHSLQSPPNTRGN